MLVMLVILLSACSSGAEETEQEAGATVEGSSPAQPAEATSAEMSSSPPKMEDTLGLAGTPWVLVMGSDSANPTVVEAGVEAVDFLYNLLCR